MAIRRKQSTGPPDFVVITMLLLIVTALCFIVYNLMDEPSYEEYGDEEVSELVIAPATAGHDLKS